MKVRKGLKYLAAMILAAGICFCAVVIMDGYSMYKEAVTQVSPVSYTHLGGKFPVSRRYSGAH